MSSPYSFKLQRTTQCKWNSCLFIDLCVLWKMSYFWICESLNVRLTSGQTGACLGVWPCEMLFCVSPMHPKSVLPWVILEHVPTAVPWFLFHAFIMWGFFFFLHSQLHKTSQVCGGWDGQPWWGAILHKPRALSGQWQPVQRMAWSGAR